MVEKRKRKLQYLVNEAGKKVSVLLPIDEYEELQEDIADLAAVAERREEATSDPAGVVARLKADGLL